MIRFGETLFEEKEVVAVLRDEIRRYEVAVLLSGGHRLKFTGPLADRVWNYFHGEIREADDPVKKLKPAPKTGQ
jgi:hypothetical protein